jgi:hypothetical protein
MRNGFMFLATVAMTAALNCVQAEAVGFEDIAGKWCTTGGVEMFERNNLIAIPTSTRQQLVYPVVSYEFKDGLVRIIWKNEKGNEVSTDYAEFSTDNQRMTQLANEKGPRREFHRC